MTQARCASVSGIGKPFAFSIAANATSGLTPLHIKTAAATTEDRPIPARQWIAIDLPVLATSAAKRMVKSTSLGRPRSGIGNDRNWMPIVSQSVASLPKSRSSTSSRSNRLITTSTPERFQCSISSSNQSPARGRAMIASFCVLAVSIQYSSDGIYSASLNGSGGCLTPSHAPRASNLFGTVMRRLARPQPRRRAA